MTRRPGAALVAFVLLGALVGCGGSGDPAAPKVEHLPAVTLQPVGAGEALDLGSLKGPAVVNVWASWCKPCKRELPLYAAFAKKYDGKVKVVGVDFQEPRQEKALEMMRTADVAYPVVADPDGDLRVVGLPKLVLVDADGKVTYAKYVEIKTAAQLEKIVRDHLGDHLGIAG